MEVRPPSMSSAFQHLLQAPPTDGLDLIILDGGLGTTLRDTFKKNCDGELWSSRLLSEDPAVVKQAHRAFLDSGADLILTCTYQAFLAGFVKHGFSENQAKELMNVAVDLAVEARDEFIAAPGFTQSGRSKPAVGLSLGSYGAILCNGEEFTGAYPTAERSVAFLKDFHLARLQLFSSKLSLVDFIAFETTPLANEVVAIRQAITELDRAGRVPFWIGLTCPAAKWADEGGMEAARQALWEGQGRVPNAVALNCTETSALAGLIPQLAPTHALQSPPTLVLYPNHNTAFMNETDNAASYWDTFDRGNKPVKLTGAQWAEQLVGVAREANRSGKWANRIICGGCCGTQPDEIAELRKIASRS